jgi:hypothetical protein
MEDKRSKLVREFLPDGVPVKLYKFYKVDQHLHDALKQGYLWHSRRASFNDPYDCYSSLLKYEPTHDQLIDYALRTLLPGESLDFITNYMLDNPQAVVDGFINTVDDVIDDMGLCCFTTKCDNTLMWSHYAKHHKGICIGFDPSKDIESFLVAKVRYRDDFAPKNYFDDPTTNAMIMYTTKSKDWEYEDEYRLVNTLSGEIPYNKQALSEIIFGCKCSQDDMLAVISTIETAGYKDISYLKAEMQPNSYSLSFRDSPWLNISSNV